jgi:hypothetical protein
MLINVLGAETPLMYTTQDSQKRSNRISAELLQIQQVLLPTEYEILKHCPSVPERSRA